MPGGKTFTLIRQYQLLTLLNFLLFLSNLLDLIFEAPEWLYRFNAVSVILFFVLYLFLLSGGKEKEDELSTKNRLKADSFVLSTITICVFGAAILLPSLVKAGHLIQISATLLLTTVWFLIFFRNATFLVYEKLGKG